VTRAGRETGRDARHELGMYHAIRERYDMRYETGMYDMSRERYQVTRRRYGDAKDVQGRDAKAKY